MPQNFSQLPDIVGRPLPPIVSVILPIARTNLVTNPSIELATTGYTAVGGSIARSAAQQYHGTYSLAVTPGAGVTDGAYYGTVSLTSGTTYATSCKLLGIAGRKYKLSIATTGGVDLAAYRFTGTGRWQWVWVIYTETSSTTRRVYFTKDGQSATGVFYVDGVQVEACETGNYWPTTYIDGDQRGLIAAQNPPAYYWTGTPHASTSVRSALTRAGGRVMRLDRYGFLLVALIGLGSATPAHVSVPYSVLDGARYQRTQKPPRSFTLAGRFQATTQQQLARQRSDLRQVLDRDYVSPQQPLILQIEPRDDCGAVNGSAALIPCLYSGGLEGNEIGAVVEEAPITFTMYVPYIATGDAGAALTVQASVANANGVLQRSASGAWSAMSTGISGGTGAYVYVRGLDGTIYVGGAFTAMGGVANTSRIAAWNGSAWSALGTGAANQSIQDMAIGPDGSLYVVGSFSGMGGVANTKGVAKWNGSAWSALGTGGDAGTTQVLGVAVAPNGDVYVAGTFTSIGGVAAASIAKWNGSAWSALSTGLTGGSLTGQKLVIDAAGNVYVGGGFTTAGGVSVTNIAKWNGSAFSALGSGLGVAGTVGPRQLAIGPDGRLYAGGAFTVSGSTTINRAGVWNGTTWQPLGSGFNADVYSISFAADGSLYASGQFSTADGVTVPDAAARWNGSAWTPLDVDLPGSPIIVYTVKAFTDGTMYAGFDTSGTATAAATTTITNAGTQITYPRLTIKGPSSGTSRIYQIVNYTTGIAVYLNYTINAGETAVFDFDPSKPSYRSDFQGDLSSKILPGSLPAQFFLRPGDNTVSFFAADSTVTATLSWQNRYSGMDDLVGR